VKVALWSGTFPQYYAEAASFSKPQRRQGSLKALLQPVYELLGARVGAPRIPRPALWRKFQGNLYKIAAQSIESSAGDTPVWLFRVIRKGVTSGRPLRPPFGPCPLKVVTSHRPQPMSV